MQRDVERTQQQPNLSRWSRFDRTSRTQSHSKGPTRLRQKGLQRQNAMAHITQNVLDNTSSHFRRVHNTPDLPIIVHSLFLTPNFCSNDLTRTTRRSGESQAFGQDRPATELSPLLCPSKFWLSILYRSIDLLKSSPPNLLLIVRFSSSHQNCLLSPLTLSHLPMPSSLLGTSSNCFSTSVGFLQKPRNSTVIPSDSVIPPFAVTAHPPSSIRLHPPSSIPAAFSLAPNNTHSQKENNHALHAVVMGHRKTKQLN